MNEYISLKYIVASILFSVIGILILVIAFYIFEKITTEDIYKEIVHKQNLAVAIVASAFMIAVAIIISSAIHG
jgi:putative membrane protein